MTRQPEEIVLAKTYRDDEPFEMLDQEWLHVLWFHTRQRSGNDIIKKHGRDWSRASNLGILLFLFFAVDTRLHGCGEDVSKAGE
jgi:hypothetical protein